MRWTWTYASNDFSTDFDTKTSTRRKPRQRGRLKNRSWEHMSIKTIEGAWKWQAAPGWLFCERVNYEPTKSVLVLAGSKGAEKLYRVLSVGPEVVGYKEGDLIQIVTGQESNMGTFVFAGLSSQPGRASNIVGRLVPASAPNSAQAVPTNGEQIARDMASAD